jgi:hypothetical protein
MAFRWKGLELGKITRVQDTGAKGRETKGEGQITHVPFGYLRIRVVYFLST